MPPVKPVLVFDGECGFCRYWVTWWRYRTGQALDYQPFQDPSIAGRFPEISRDRFARAVHLIEPDGEVSDGALAVFRTLAISGSRLPLWLYHRMPGGAAVAERAYRLVADHRPFFSRLTTILWGRDAGPATSALSSWLFLRLLGVVYLVAFWSLGVQIRALIGHDGILPARDLMTAAHRWADGQQVGFDRFRVLPTLAWLSTSDRFLEGLCYGGSALSLLLVAGIAPLVLLPLLWLGYLSLVVVAGEFLSFQWDVLLLETGVLAMLIAPLARWDRLGRHVDPPRAARWLLWWLLFRLMFGSGLVKLTSGDPTWPGLTALTFHYETQPIPTPIAWYANLLPLWFQTGSTALALGIELVVPWFIFTPRRLRCWAAMLLVGFQGLIGLTGNYAFFNLLTIALCLFLLDDAAIERLVPVLRQYAPESHMDHDIAESQDYRIAESKATVGWRWSLRAGSPARQPRWGARAEAPTRQPRWGALSIAIAVVIVPVSLVTLAGRSGVDLPGSVLVAPVANLIEPFHSVNAYGLFAVMTTTRPEIVVEGSDDGVTWLAYEFTYKPGDARRRPPWVAPHQPRVDWQMWFAALGRYQDEGWFRNFCMRLLEGSPDVLRLLARNPFPDTPPRLVRGVLYQYHFADAVTGRREGVWWVRERLGLYSPEISLTRPR